MIERCRKSNLATNLSNDDSVIKEIRDHLEKISRAKGGGTGSSSGSGSAEAGKSLIGAGKDGLGAWNLAGGECKTAWSVAKNVLVGTCKNESSPAHEDLLLTKATYVDYDLSFKLRIRTGKVLVYPRRNGEQGKTSFGFFLKDPRDEAKVNAYTIKLRSSRCEVWNDGEKQADSEVRNVAPEGSIGFALTPGSSVEITDIIVTPIK